MWWHIIDYGENRCLNVLSNFLRDKGNGITRWEFIIFRNEKTGYRDRNILQDKTFTR